MSYEVIKKGIVKRTQRREIGLFIDGVGLDRATRRLNRKVNMAALVRGVTSGLTPVVARYYTLIPFEDDSRHRAFLDAVSRAGLTVIVKRLPPKGVNRQVSVEPEMAADIIAYAMGYTDFSSEHEYRPGGTEPSAQRGSALPGGLRLRRTGAAGQTAQEDVEEREEERPAQESTSLAAAPRVERPENRIVTLVCPSRELSYPVTLARELGVDTVSADFGQFNAGDVMKSAAKWIDLSDSETIWRD